MKISLDDVVIFRVSVSTIGRYRTIGGENIKSLRGEDEESPSEESRKKVDRRKLRMAKEIIPGEFIKAITRLDTEFAALFKRLTLPGFFGRGDRISHIGKAEKIAFLADQYQKERDMLIDVFVSQIDAAKAAAKDSLQHLYDEDDYPKTDRALRACFGVQFMAFEVGVHPKLPENLKNVMGTALTQQWEQTFQAGQAELRAEFVKLIETLLGEINPSTGKTGRIYDSVLDSLRTFAAEFGDRDLSGDQEMEILVGKVGATLGSLTADDLRDYKGTKEEIAGVLSEVLSQTEEIGRLLDV